MSSARSCSLSWCAARDDTPSTSAATSAVRRQQTDVTSVVHTTALTCQKNLTFRIVKLSISIIINIIIVTTPIVIFPNSLTFVFIIIITSSWIWHFQSRQKSPSKKVLPTTGPTAQNRCTSGRPIPAPCQSRGAKTPAPSALPVEAIGAAYRSHWRCPSEPFALPIGAIKISICRPDTDAVSATKAIAPPCTCSALIFVPEQKCYRCCRNTLLFTPQVVETIS